MSKTRESAGEWQEANQRLLMAAVAEVRGLLRAHTARAGQRPAPEGPPAPDESALAVSALGRVSSLFSLSSFERRILTLCAGMELDAAAARECADAQGDPQLTHPTFSLALAAFPDAHWSALSPLAPLRRWRLIEAGGDSLTAGPLRIDERVLHYLTGLSFLDQRLHGMLTAVEVPERLPPSQAAVARSLERIWRRVEPPAGPPLVNLCGPDRVARRDVAAIACAALGLRLQRLHGQDAPATPAERETLAGLWERESALSGCALLVECELLEGTDPAAGHRLLERLTGAVVATSREPLRGLDRPSVRLDLDWPSSREQRALWRATLGRQAASLNGQVDAVVSQFRMGAHQIRSAGVQVRADLGWQDKAARGTALWNACRAQARPRLDDLAQRIVSSARWDNLVLPGPQKALLREIAAHVRQRPRVCEAWGFAAQAPRGMGTSTLFSGPSGTGKTMAAEVLAAELRLDLYRIDLSQVVSKYIGETEKNLRRVFDAAEEGGAVLLFDEADALFGKRSEVKDSHDRYANIEVGYLLQRMEQYRGLAVLTTNAKNALDPAFLRRLRFVVQFPFPEPAERAEIWKRAFPPDAPTEGLDWVKLARLSVAGGNIHNIALNAAFLAADANQPVGMAHLLRSARAESDKLEQPLDEMETRGWV